MSRNELKRRMEAAARNLAHAGHVRAASKMASIVARYTKAAPGLDVEDTEVGDADAGDGDPGEPDLMTRLKDESDMIVQILKSQDPNGELRKDIRALNGQIRSLQTTLRDLGKGFVDALGVEELKEIDESGVGELRDTFTDAAADLDELLQASSVLKSYEGRIRQDTSLAPVQHKLPQKTKREVEQATIRTKK